MPAGVRRCPKCRHWTREHERVWKEINIGIQVSRPPLKAGYRCKRCPCVYFPRPKNEDYYYG